MRNKIPSFIVTIIGLVLIAEYFVDAPFLSSLASEFKNWGVILGAAAIVLGIVNIVVVNVRAVRNRKADRVSTSLLFVALAVFGSLGIIKGTELPFYQTMYTNMYIPMATTIFSMKIFYMLSAAYRSFVAKRGEATVMLGISLITLVTVVSIGEQIFPSAPVILDWLQQVPNVAGQRGILLGAALGSFATALRTILGYERSNVGL
jgi:hypothetical protein